MKTFHFKIGLCNTDSIQMGKPSEATAPIEQVTESDETTPCNSYTHIH